MDFKDPIDSILRRLAALNQSRTKGSVDGEIYWLERVIRAFFVNLISLLLALNSVFVCCILCFQLSQQVLHVDNVFGDEHVLCFGVFVHHSFF